MSGNMKKNPAAGLGKVYWFSLRQMICSKGWLGSTIVIGVLLLIAIPLVLLGISAAANKEDKDDGSETEIRTVYIVDETEGEADYNALNELRADDEKLEFNVCFSMDDAIGAAANHNDAVILRVTKPAEKYALTVYLPQVTEVSRGKASKLGSELESAFSVILMQKAALTPEGVMLLNMPVVSETEALNADASSDDEDDNFAAEILGFLIPFMMLMTVYMMVILYGQSMANSVMLEKNSKLIETILTAVHPVALMAGKLLATASAAIMQILIWLAALTAGTLCGAVFAIRMIPDTESTTVIAVNEVMHQVTDIPYAGIAVSILIMALGFLLYLSLSAVSGAVAAKQEDLNKTNVVFTLVLVVSFLLSIAKPDEIAAAGDTEVSFISSAMWLRFCPFTAILCMPSDLVLGKVGVGVTLASLGIMIASVALFVVIAAFIYKMLVLYRGETPNLKTLFAMIKENLGKKPAQTNTPDVPPAPPASE